MRGATDSDGKIFAVPIEQKPGSAEPETDVFRKIANDEQKAAPTPAPVRRVRKSLSRRIVRRILGPTLMTRKD